MNPLSHDPQSTFNTIYTSGSLNFFHSPALSSAFNMDYMLDGLPTAALYANGTLDRYTNGTAWIPRISGKIAIEEAVGTEIWQAYTTLPATDQINGYAGVPFSDVSLTLLPLSESTRILTFSGPRRRYHRPSH